MTDKKLVLHFRLCDGIVLNPSARGYQTVDQLINCWLASEARGYIGDTGKWTRNTSPDDITKASLSYSAYYADRMDASPSPATFSENIQTGE